MIVHLIETGGWTNVRTGCTVDVDTLADPAASELARVLCERAHLFVDHVAPKGAWDARTVSIEVECLDHARRASFSEAAPPEELLPLLELLRPLCAPMPQPRQR